MIIGLSIKKLEKAFFDLNKLKMFVLKYYTFETSNLMEEMNYSLLNQRLRNNIADFEEPLVSIIQKQPNKRTFLITQRTFCKKFISPHNFHSISVGDFIAS